MKKFLTLALAVALIGCASEPKAEKDAATKAKDAADKVEAGVYAKAGYDDAVAAWTKAEGMNKEKKFDEAKKAYVDATTKFNKSAADAPAGKDEMMKAADAAKADAMKAMEASGKDKMVMAAMKGKDKAKYEAAKKAYDDAMAAGATGNAMEMKAKYDEAKAKADEMMSMANPKKDAMKK